MDARRVAVSSLRAKIVGQSSWGCSVCREGATRLSLDGQVAATELTTLLRYACASGATEIKLRNCYVGRSGLAALAGAASRGVLDQLLVLNLSHDFIDDDGLEILAGAVSGGLRSLRVLNLSNNYITDKGLKQLCATVAQAPPHGSQRQQGTDSGRTGSDGPPVAAATTHRDAWTCARPPPLAALTCLRIAGVADAFGDSAIRVLAATLTDGALPSLQHLVVPRGQEKNVPLRTACRVRHIRLS